MPKIHYIDRIRQRKKEEKERLEAKDEPKVVISDEERALRRKRQQEHQADLLGILKGEQRGIGWSQKLKDRSDNRFDTEDIPPVNDIPY